MQIQIRGKNTKVTDALRSTIEEKMDKVHRHFDQIIEGTVELSVEKNPKITKNQRVEITLHVKGSTIRAEKSSDDMYSAIDDAAHKIERQVERYKGRVYASSASHHNHNTPATLREIEPPGPIVRRKKHDLKPMSPDEARLQLDLLQHEFYVFRNADSGDVNVIYKRKDGDYGLIEPSI